jgi:hypothetical protein
MDAFTTLCILFGSLFAAIAAIVLRYFVASRRKRARYLSLQAARPALSDSEFCRLAGVNPSHAAIVGTIRSYLAACFRCDALRMYPEDDWPSSVLQYDDDVAGLVEEIGVLPDFKQYWFPMERVDSLGDFVRVVLELRARPEE